MTELFLETAPVEGPDPDLNSSQGCKEAPERLRGAQMHVIKVQQANVEFESNKGRNTKMLSRY